MSGSLRPIPAAELADTIGSDDFALGGDGTEPKPACILVDLDGPIPNWADLGDTMDLVPAVMVGVAFQQMSARARDFARHLTCTLVLPEGPADPPFVQVRDPSRTARDLFEAVGHSPRASMTLSLLLRQTLEAPVAHALAAESAAYSMLLAGSEFSRWLTHHPRLERADIDDTPAVNLLRRDDTLHVVLNRPGRRNAMDRFIRDGLIAALDLAAADSSVRSIELRGNGAAFCSGGDLAEFGTSTDVSTAHLVRLNRSVALRAFRSRGKLTAHLHGACIGAGIEIASFAGRLVAREGTFVRLPELSMGLIPGAGGTVGIPRRIGRWRTAYLALSGEQLDLATALKWGLVDAIAED